MHPVQLRMYNMKNSTKYTSWKHDQKRNKMLEN